MKTILTIFGLFLAGMCFAAETNVPAKPTFAHLVTPQSVSPAKPDKQTKQALLELEEEIRETVLQVVHLEVERDKLAARVKKEPDVYTKAQQKAIPSQPKHFDLEQYMQERKALLAFLKNRMEEIKAQFYFPGTVMKVGPSEQPRDE